MSGHTPGPWEIDANEHGDQTRRFVWPEEDLRPHAGTHCVATINPRNTVEELEANARLIAAAPELLAALKQIAGDVTSFFQGDVVVRDADADTHGTGLSLADIRKIIAKAEGSK